MIGMGYFPNPTIFLAEEAGGAEHISTLALFVYFFIVIGIIMGCMVYAKPGLNERVFKNPVTQLFEQLYLFIQNMCLGIIGPGGRKYVPMIMTFWLVIFVSNVLGLFTSLTPTAVLSFNLGMALISIGYVQVEGVKANGLLGHLRHFAGPSFEGPKALVIILTVLISPLIFSIEIVSELMKNVSLSLRLFGNIHGGHEAVSAMNELGRHIKGNPYINIPFGSFLLPIKFLTCIVQALIFSLLTCVYISLVTHHGDDSHGSDHGEHH